MRKSRIALCGLVVAALAMGGLFLVGSAEGQFSGGGSRLVELTPPITTSTAQTGIAPQPVGKMVKAFNRLLGVTKVTAAPSGGSGSQLDVFYQYSADGGMTRQDFAHVQVLQTTGTYLIPVSVVAAGPTVVPPIMDGSLGGNNIIQGPLGDMLRIKYSAAFGTSTGNWTFQSFVTPD